MYLKQYMDKYYMDNSELFITWFLIQNVYLKIKNDTSLKENERNHFKFFSEIKGDNLIILFQ